MIKKYLPTSLYGRTFLIVMIPVLILQIAVSIVFFDRHWSKMTERLAFAVTGEILAVANQINEAPQDIERQNRIKGIVGDFLSLKMAYKYGTDLSDIDYVTSRPLWMNPFETIEKDLSKQLRKHSGFEFKVMNIPNEKLVEVHIQLDEGLLSVSIPEGRLFSSSSYIFILWMIGLSVLLFTIAMIFMRNQIRPIYRLGIIAERLGRGIPVGKIKPSGAREVRQAAEAFVNMQDRINQFITQRTTMLAGVSHDLRTPLTRMKLQLEMMGDTPDTDAMRSDIHDMERMIEGYLSFAKGDGGEEMQRVNLKDILNKTIDDARRLSLDVDDNRDGRDDCMIWAKPTALSRALGNFVINAKRHANQIMVEVLNNNESITISIHDNGEGISADKVQDLMKPFVRGEESRNQKTGGVGLGLTIANDIIMSHGGKLKLSESLGLGGLRVDITIPL